MHGRTWATLAAACFCMVVASGCGVAAKAVESAGGKLVAKGVETGAAGALERGGAEAGAAAGARAADAVSGIASDGRGGIRAGIDAATGKATQPDVGTLTGHAVQPAGGNGGVADLAHAATSAENPLKAVDKVPPSKVASELGLSSADQARLKARALPVKQIVVDSRVNRIRSETSDFTRDFIWSLACTTGANVALDGRLPTEPELMDFVTSKARDRGLKALGVSGRTLVAHELSNLGTDLQQNKRTNAEALKEVVVMTCEEVNH